jgi:transposase InsO family protein
VRRVGRLIGKKIQRLWREEGLRVPRRTRKRLRLGDSTVPAVRRAERPNHVWALDFQFDTTVDGRTLKLLARRRRAHPRSARDPGCSLD